MCCNFLNPTQVVVAVIVKVLVVVYFDYSWSFMITLVRLLEH
jgi:hypothetical protein